MNTAVVSAFAKIVTGVVEMLPSNVFSSEGLIGQADAETQSMLAEFEEAEDDDMDYMEDASSKWVDHGSFLQPLTDLFFSQRVQHPSESG
jgi:hypothetical protein